MKSKWYKLKPKAIKLRSRGLSIRVIEKRLKIPRSTLSGWLKNVKLSQKQKERLHRYWLNALVKARKKAVKWHNAQKQGRIQAAKNQAVEVLGRLDHNNPYILELALAILYMGEGTRASDYTSLGSSDPLILKFFLSCLEKIYKLERKKISCTLHLRADQDQEDMKFFWSKELKIPLSNFRKVSMDKRTVGKKTYSHYKGVCILGCGNVAIQRRLVFISQLFCKNIII